MGERLGPLLVALLAAAPALAAADDYQAALDGAAGEAAAGRYREAARRLEGPAGRWPQDLPLQLALAYDLLRAGEYDRAEEAYRRALELEPDSADARRGLDDARLRRGEPTRFWAGLFAGGASAAALPGLGGLGVGAATLDGTVDDHLTLGLLYRALVWSDPAAAGGMGRGRGAAGGGASLDGQQEGHLSVGWAEPGWSVSLQGAAISRATAAGPTGAVEVGHPGVAGGLSGLLVAGLEWRAAIAGASYDDHGVGQLEASAALPIGDRFAVRLGGRGQLAPGSEGGAGMVAVELRGPWAASLSGEVGRELRPIDLEERILYDSDQALAWAARARLGFPISGALRGWAGADLEAWRGGPVGLPPASGIVERLAAGLVFSF